MITEQDLIAVADSYADATGVIDATISYRVFADSKKLAAMRAGGSITLKRANDALAWFSANWPDGAVWPGHVCRPQASEPAQ